MNDSSLMRESISPSRADVEQIRRRIRASGTQEDMIRLMAPHHVVDQEIGRDGELAPRLFLAGETYAR